MASLEAANGHPLAAFLLSQNPAPICPVGALTAGYGLELHYGVHPVRTSWAHFLETPVSIGKVTAV
jgi:hypothetical protein